VETVVGQRVKSINGVEYTHQREWDGEKYVNFWGNQLIEDHYTVSILGKDAGRFRLFVYQTTPSRFLKRDMVVLVEKWKGDDKVKDIQKTSRRRAKRLYPDTFKDLGEYKEVWL
jgi:hypothetical protein